MEIEKIMQHTPYNSYDDLFGAVYSNKAKIRLSNTACREIASIETPIVANFGMHFGFIASAIMTIVMAICFSNYWLLLLLPFEVIFSFAAYLLHNLKIKTWYIALIIVICDLFFMRLPTFLLVTSLSWIMCSWSVSWWAKKAYITSIKILKRNQDAFIWAYNSNHLLIEDCFGNVYSKIQQNQAKQPAYERLLKVIKIGTDAENIDDAISLFSTFYKNKGKDIPDNLYLNIDCLSDQKKNENLLRILEIGLGMTGLENITNSLIDFYKRKGIDFPNDI